MKKRILVAVLVLAVACMCLVGCGSGDFEGKWECEEMSAGGMTIKDNIMGIPVAIMMQFELKSDGKGTYRTYDNGNTTTKDLTWELDGKTCKVKVEDTTYDFKLDGGKLVASYTKNTTTATVKLKKVDKFTEFTEEDAKNALGGLMGSDD